MGMHKKKLLIVDDDEELRQSLKIALERKGFEVETVEDGAAALNSIRKNVPDYVVLDLFMPRKEGLETLRELREICPDLPIYVVTGGGRSELFELLRVAAGFGSTGVLRKPFTANELVAMIENDERGASHTKISSTKK